VVERRTTLGDRVVFVVDAVVVVVVVVVVVRESLPYHIAAFCLRFCDDGPCL
jgi:hypothetical protein